MKKIIMMILILMTALLAISCKAQAVIPEEQEETLFEGMKESPFKRPDIEIAEEDIEEVSEGDLAYCSIVSNCNTTDYAYSVYIESNYAYIADSESGLQIIDINDKENPQIMSSCNTTGSAYSVYVKENYAYVADGKADLTIIELR